jgi:hypothetical protein
LLETYFQVLVQVRSGALLITLRSVARNLIFFRSARFIEHTALCAYVCSATVGTRRPLGPLPLLHVIYRASHALTLNRFKDPQISTFFPSTPTYFVGIELACLTPCRYRLIDGIQASHDNTCHNSARKGRRISPNHIATEATMYLGSGLDLVLLENWNVAQEVLLIGIDRYRRADCVGSDKIELS